MPSFLLRRGELLHPSDLVEQLWDEVLRGEGKDRNTCGDSEWQICTSEMFTWRGRGSLWAGEWRRTVFYLSRFKTVNQQILQNREKQDEITAVCSHLSCSETGCTCVLPWPWLPVQHHWACRAVHPHLSPAQGWPLPIAHVTKEGEKQSTIRDQTSTRLPYKNAREPLSTNTWKEVLILSILSACVYIMWLSANRPASVSISLSVWCGTVIDECPAVDTRGRRASISPKHMAERHEETKREEKQHRQVSFFFLNLLEWKNSLFSRLEN